MVAIVLVGILLFISALISGSEVAFFSLSPSQKKKLGKGETKARKVVVQLLDHPERLLGTILVTNNFVNVGIVILASFITTSIFDFSESPLLGFIFQIIMITFLLLLFGEILPKIYATQHSLKFSIFMAYPIYILDKVFRPVSAFLISSTSLVNRYFGRRKKNITMDELSDAIELTTNESTEEKQILRGIVKFGNIESKEIMKSRTDITAIEINDPLSKVYEVIVESGFSRIPVYEEDFDHIKGILYIKDLLPYFDKENSFEWQKLMRPPYFVPETKKINVLLEEFQTKKIHMAVVIDEYGGTSGIITLEDILEEIVGEINDESDDDEQQYIKIDAWNYVFEGKTLLNDFYKITGIDDYFFDNIKGDADTLAGLILELKGEIPDKNDIITYKNFTFKIEAVDNRRIKKIRIHLK